MNNYIIFSIIEKRMKDKTQKDFNLFIDLIEEYIKVYLKDIENDDEYIKDFEDKSLIVKHYEFYNKMFSYLFSDRKLLNVFENYEYNNDPYIVYFHVHSVLKENVKKYKNFTDKKEWKEPMNIFYEEKKIIKRKNK